MIVEARKNEYRLLRDDVLQEVDIFGTDILISYAGDGVDGLLRRRGSLPPNGANAGLHQFNEKHRFNVDFKK